jgi:serpin B
MTVALPTGSEAAALGEMLGGGLADPGEPGLRLVMPRWSYRVETGLKDPLKHLGMAVAFGDEADFSAMTKEARLAITDVLHQTFVAVDEAGTEAAAATAVVMGETALAVTRHRLVLDRPFVYVVHDTAHGTPLFVGRVADPSSDRS